MKDAERRDPRIKSTEHENGSERPRRIISTRSSLSDFLSGAAFYGLLILTCAAAAASGSVDAWTRAAFAALVAAIAALRVLSQLIAGTFRFASARMLSPMLAVVLLATYQLVPFGPSGAAATFDRYETVSFILVFGSLVIYSEALFTLTDSDRRLRLLLATVVAIATVSALFGIARHAGGFAPYTASEQSFAQFAYRNHFATLALMGLGLLLGLLLRAPFGGRLKFPAWLCIGILFYAIVLSSSRGGILSAGVVILFTVFLYVSGRSKDLGGNHGDNVTGRGSWLRRAAFGAAVCVLFVGMLGIVVSFIGGEYVVGRFERLGNEAVAPDGSRINRSMIWLSTLEMIRAHPVTGVGFGAYEAAISRYDIGNGSWRPGQAHNEYLELLANGGVVGLGLFAVFGILVCKRIAKNLGSPSRFRSGYCLGASIGMLGSLVHILVDFGLHSIANSSVLVVLLVIATVHLPERANHNGRGLMKVSKANLRLVVGGLYLVLLCGIAAIAGRHALSNFYVDNARRNNSPADASRAITSQPRNPHAWHARGDLLYLSGDYNGAVAAFREAVSLRPHDYVLWMRLADAHFRSGDADTARSAFEAAIGQAPNYAAPQFSIGQVLLATGDISSAFESMTRAAARDRTLYPSVFELANAAFGDDPISIERVLSSETAYARQFVARSFIERGWMTEGVRAYLVDGNLAGDQRSYFVGALLGKGQYQLAHEVWSSGFDRKGSPEPLHDGGFELITESDPSGLGWQIDQKISGVSVALDRKEVHAGEQSISIRFSGNVETGRPIVSQLAFLEPRRRYTLSFFFRAAGIVSASLPVVFVHDPEGSQPIAVSETLGNTAGKWVRGEVSFTTRDSEVVSVSLRRQSCNLRPCPLFGDLWIDDISLLSISAGR